MTDMPGGDVRASDLEIYKLLVEMADRVSVRRANVNVFFLTLNSGLAAFVGVAGAPATSSLDRFRLTLTGAAGILLALTWLVLLRTYRRLNWAKFEVITELEKEMPTAPYTDEWNFLKPTGRSQFGLAAWYLESSFVEQVVPLVFAGIYAALIARVWWS